MIIRLVLAAALMMALVACRQASAPPPLPPLLQVSPSTAQVGDTVSVTYRGVTGAARVTIDGLEAQQVGAPVAGANQTLVMDVIVPRGAVGWSSLAVSSSETTVAIEAADRAFFVGTVLTSLATTLQAVQDALDAIDAGGALLIPAGTYAGSEPLGGLVIDNRLLVGSGEGATSLEGVTQLSVYARSVNTAGIADLTLAADAATVHGGMVASTAAWPIVGVPVTTPLGRFLVWNATWTGNDPITPPVINPATLEVTAYGAAGGLLTRDASAVNVAFELDGATIILHDMDMFDSSAIGSWTIVDSDIWVQDRFQVYQESGNVSVRNSRIAQVGDPDTALEWPRLEFEMDSFDGELVDSVLTATGEFRFEADDGGNRQIVRTKVRSERLMDLEGDYLGSLLIEDSWLYTNDRIDMGDAADVGWVRIERSTLDAHDNIYVDLSDGFQIDVIGSTLRSRSSNIRLEVSEGTISIIDSTLEAATYVDIEADDAGNIDVIRSVITAGTYIDVYIDYFGTLTIEDSTLFAGEYLHLDPWSGGSTQIDVRNSLLEAVERVLINDTDGGDVTIEGSTLRSYCSSIDVKRDTGSIDLSDSRLETVGTMPQGDACIAVGGLDSAPGGLNVFLSTESGMLVMSGVTIDAQGDVLVEDYSGGSDAPPAVITSVGSADMRVGGGSSITAAGDVRFGTAGALEVLSSQVSAGGVIVLASPLLGDIDTSASTFSPAPTLVTAFP